MSPFSQLYFQYIIIQRHKIEQWSTLLSFSISLRTAIHKPVGDEKNNNNAMIRFTHAITGGFIAAFFIRASRKQIHTLVNNTPWSQNQKTIIAIWNTFNMKAWKLHRHDGSNRHQGVGITKLQN